MFKKIALCRRRNFLDIAREISDGERVHLAVLRAVICEKAAVDVSLNTALALVRVMIDYRKVFSTGVCNAVLVVAVLVHCRFFRRGFDIVLPPLVRYSEILCRVYGFAVFADLKVTVTAEGVAGVALDSDHVPRLDLLSDFDFSRRHVAHENLKSVSRVNANVVAPLPCEIRLVRDDCRRAYNSVTRCNERLVRTAEVYAFVVVALSVERSPAEMRCKRDLAALVREIHFHCALPPSCGGSVGSAITALYSPVATSLPPRL